MTRYLKVLFVIAGLLLVGGVFWLYGNQSQSEPDVFAERSKSLILSENGLRYFFSGVQEPTVGEFLRAKRLSLLADELVFPPVDTKLVSGMTILVTRPYELSLRIDGETRPARVFSRTAGTVLDEIGVTLDEDDIVVPDRTAFTFRGSKISVTRVQITEQVVEKSVPFEKKIYEDDALSWRKTVLTQPGENGIDRLVYRVSSHDGKEVSRKLLRTERIKEPVPEKVTQGTYVKLGKSHTGAASWYAWTGTLAAANPWLPKGSYVKVTNTENGKSVIVVINDRGPFVPGRIIDLDKVAFAKIASVGAGVINVKMEEITN